MNIDDIAFANTFAQRPHLVIIGAGATMDAIPNGDKNGKRSSVMEGFIETLGFTDTIKDANLCIESNNLEDVYSALAECESCNSIRLNLENAIFSYFYSLELPDSITKYDLLIASLTKKDCIASFNWDGLLVDAYLRLMKITDDLPEIIFLHGNVKVGYCADCDTFGYYRLSCPKCGTPFSRTRLLYPIKHKNYSNDIFIRKQWRIFEDFLSRAAIVTIYGYSAPKTDIEAIEKLQNAFTRIAINRFLDEIQIIEREGFNHNNISDAWVNLSSNVHGHLNIYDSFFDTYLAEFPRRSVEGYAKRNILGWWGDSPLSFTKKRGCNYTFNELRNYILPLLNDEEYNSISISSK